MSSLPPRDPSNPPSTPGYVLDATGLRLYDGTRNDYMQDGDLGVTMHLDAVAGDAQFRGTVRASQIQGHQGGRGGTGARMWLDFTAGDPLIAPAGATPGVSPYWAVADDKGVVRVEAGYLAAIGNSPIQWGMRANDQNGTPIFDSLGLIQTMTVVGAINGLNGVTSSSSFVQIGSSATFVTTRIQNVLVIASLSVNADMSVYPNNGGQVRISLDGQLSQIAFLKANYVGEPNFVTLFLDAVALAAGTHTLSIVGQISSAATDVNIADGTVRAFLLGG